MPEALTLTNVVLPEPRSRANTSRYVVESALVTRFFASLRKTTERPSPLKIGRDELPPPLVQGRVVVEPRLVGPISVAPVCHRRPNIWMEVKQTRIPFAVLSRDLTVQRIDRSQGRRTRLV